MLMANTHYISSLLGSGTWSKLMPSTPLAYILARMSQSPHCLISPSCSAWAIGAELSYWALESAPSSHRSWFITPLNPFLLPLIPLLIMNLSIFKYTCPQMRAVEFSIPCTGPLLTTRVATNCSNNLFFSCWIWRVKSCTAAKVNLRYSSSTSNLHTQSRLTIQ